jgi:hypothetical protein
LTQETRLKIATNPEMVIDLDDNEEDQQNQDIIESTNKIVPMENKSLKNERNSL